MFARCASSVPFSVWQHPYVDVMRQLGVLEGKHAKVVGDTIKGLLLNCCIAPPLIALFLRVIHWGGEQFYLYVAALFLVVQLVAVPVYSNLIQPCFNKVEPLQDGTLRTSIEELAKCVEFPLTGLYVIDGSKRSSHSNAYFYGSVVLSPASLALHAAHLELLSGRESHTRSPLFRAVIFCLHFACC